MAPARRRSRALRAVRIALALVASSTLLGAGPAEGQDIGAGPSLGGYAGRAAASGLQATYAPEGLIPTGPPIDLGAPDALATIASGPSTFARASAADPGDLLANPDALLTLASSDYPSGTIPAYPYRVSASSGVGEPSAESNPAPGLQARVNATPNGSSARATMPALAAPAVATVGSMASTATTRLEGATVTVHARSELNGIDVLGGLLHIESLVTDLTASSSGTSTKLEGGTTVTGATVMEQPVTIDEKGVRGTVGGVDANTLLRSAGITVTLPGPVDLDGEESGQRASTGLRIEIGVSDEQVPGLSDVLGGLPALPAFVEDLLAAARARHLVRMELGRGIVDLAAREVASFTTPAPLTPSLAPPIAPPAVAPAAPLPEPVAPEAEAPATEAPTPVSDVGELSLGTGVGALAILLLLVQPFVGAQLARIGALQLADTQEACTWQRA
jgi:hypothetical protein